MPTYPYHSSCPPHWQTPVGFLYLRSISLSPFFFILFEKLLSKKFILLCFSFCKSRFWAQICHNYLYQVHCLLIMYQIGTNISFNNWFLSKLPVTQISLYYSCLKAFSDNALAVRLSSKSMLNPFFLLFYPVPSNSPNIFIFHKITMLLFILTLCSVLWAECVPPKLLCWSPNSSVWWYLEIGPLGGNLV